jgi:hypothetical protein
MPGDAFKRRQSPFGDIKNVPPRLEFGGCRATEVILSGEENFMKRTTINAAAAIAFLAPAAAFAQNFQAVDTIPWPDGGRFPAYAGEPLRPTEVWVQGGLLHDNNIFRLSKDVNTRAVLGNDNRSETIGRLGAGIRHEMLVAGRQRLRLEARGDQYVYHDHSLLNHFEYGLRGEWLWEFTNDLSGAVGYDRRTRLIDLAQQQRPIKDTITEDHAYANGAYRLGPSVRLRGALDGTNAKHSDSALQAAGIHATSVIGGVDYVTTLGNAIGVEGRRTQGNAPTTQLVGGTTLVDNEFVEKELAVVGTLAASPQLTGTARIGHTVRNHKQFPQRDFKGTTWRASVDWTPLQKTGFEFSLYREPRSIVDIAASYVTTTGVTFGPRWAPTEKLVFYVLLVQERQLFAGDPGVIVLGTPQRDETLRTVRLAVGWEPKRFIEVSGALDHGIRTSNTLFRDYDYNALMANVRFRF